MILEWGITIAHAALSIAMVYGVLFTRTPISQAAVLATLALIFFGIRIYNGCLMDRFELCNNKPILAEIGRALITRSDSQQSIYQYEETVVGNLLVIHLIKIFALSIYPMETLF